jgi:hypothetical protein
MPSTTRRRRRQPDPRVAMVAQFAALVHAHFRGDPFKAHCARAELRKHGVAVEFLPPAMLREGAGQ